MSKRACTFSLANLLAESAHIIFTSVTNCFEVNFSETDSAKSSFNYTPIQRLPIFIASIPEVPEPKNKSKTISFFFVYLS